MINWADSIIHRQCSSLFKCNIRDEYAHLSTMHLRMAQQLSRLSEIFWANSIGFSCWVPRITCWAELRGETRETYPSFIASEPARRASNTGLYKCQFASSAISSPVQSTWPAYTSCSSSQSRVLLPIERYHEYTIHPCLSLPSEYPTFLSNQLLPIGMNPIH